MLLSFPVVPGFYFKPTLKYNNTSSPFQPIVHYVLLFLLITIKYFINFIYSWRLQNISFTFIHNNKGFPEGKVIKHIDTGM